MDEKTNPPFFLNLEPRNAGLLRRSGACQAAIPSIPSRKTAFENRELTMVSDCNTGLQHFTAGDFGLLERIVNE